MVLRLFAFLCCFFLSYVEAKVTYKKVGTSKENPEALLQRETKILNQLEKLHQRNRKSVQKRSQLEEQLSRVKNDQEDLAAQIDELRGNLKSRQKAFFSHFFMLKSLQSSQMLDKIFISKSPGHLDRKAKLLEIYAHQSFDEVIETVQSVNELQTREQQYITRFKDIQKLMAEIEAQEMRLQKEVLVKKKILSALQKRKNLALHDRQRIRNFLKSQGQDESLLDQLFGTSLQDRKGKLVWPLQGRAEKNLGYRFQKDEKIQLPNKGVFIASADEKPEVIAIEAGTVRMVEEIPGMGKTIIIDHGDRFMSVYSGLKDVAVQMDEVVKIQQFIGMASESIYHGQRGAYFELRHFGEPLSVLQWLRTQ